MNMNEETDRLETEIFRGELPLRLELDAVARLVEKIGTRDKNCVDIALGSPVMSRALRRLGGEWRSLARSRAEGDVFGGFLGETVACFDKEGKMPLRERCADLVVVGRDFLSLTPDDDLPLRECHRILNTGGALVISVEHEKPLGLAKRFWRSAACGTKRTGYTEREFCRELRAGFDVLSVRSYCRFWVEMARRWEKARLAACSGDDAELIELIRRRAAKLFSPAYQMDGLLWGGRGYALIMHARKRSWRESRAPVLTDGRQISEVVLSKAT